MKTILVDAVDCYISAEGVIFDEMHRLLESYPNRKIVLTGANDEQYKKFGLEKIQYDVFTLKHDPEKTNPIYFKKLLEKYSLRPGDCVYFEHNPVAVKSAESLGIVSYFYDYEKKDLHALKSFLDTEVIEGKSLAVEEGSDFKA